MTKLSDRYRAWSASLSTPTMTQFSLIFCVLKFLNCVASLIKQVFSFIMFDDAINLSRLRIRRIKDSLLNADNIIGNTADKCAGLIRMVLQPAVFVGTITLILASGIKDNPVGAELSFNK